jgi:pimeloyl-ACP methyl ester carboxylesterase
MRLAAQKLGMERATIVGHSFGGSIALAWALDAPAFVEGLVLLSAPSHVWPGSAGRLYDIAGIPVVGYLFSQLVPVLANERRIRQAVAAIYAPQEVPEGYIAHVDAQISVQADVFRANTAQIGALKPQIREMVPGYAGLTIPVEIIHGRADEVVPAQIHSEPLSKVLPNGRLTLLDGIGHMPHHVAPDVFRKALSRVIAAR